MDDIMQQMPKLIVEESQDAMKYAALAIDHREDHPELADMFMQLSADELRHMKTISDKMAGMVSKLHEQYNNA